MTEVPEFNVLTYASLDYELVEAFCAISCAWCDNDLQEGDPLFVWGAPMGDTGEYVSLNTLCSQKCVDERLASHAEDENITSYKTIVREGDR